MPRHEHFEELAAIAAKGELTPAEEQELSEHLAVCPQCSQVYEEYEELHAPLRPRIDPKIEALMESSREKVKGAVLEAIGNGQPQPRSDPPGFRSPALLWNPSRIIWASLATASALALMFWLGTRFEQHAVRASALSSERERNASGASPDQNAERTAAALPDGTQGQPDASQSAELLKDLRTEKERGTRLDAALADAERQLVESENSRTLLQQQVDSESQELRSTQSLLAAKTDELKQMEASKTSDANSVLALEDQIQDLTGKLNDQTQSLDRERQLLSNGRDIRDIIGARNLHIIDVYDTDAQGNTRKSFARAFYTEGKSLIFYAYDLPARGTEDGKYVYTAWGERNGNKSRVQKLGILLNDDKGQKRWALNFSDPKVLNEIDSVFVTLERGDTNGSEPQGKRMLTAYLDSQVNHP